MPKRKRLPSFGLEIFLAVLLATLGVSAWSSHAKTLRFGGYEWQVREDDRGGPGPNEWSDDNAWLDERGWLHLRISASSGRWRCAELHTTQRLGFGTYEFVISGPIDRLDRNVVLGLFNYPTSDVGRDRTNEIDIEFAQWGREGAPHGNFTVWPVNLAAGPTTKTFRFHVPGSWTRHSFRWTPSRIVFESRAVPPESRGLLKKWKFVPRDPTERISQNAMPVHMNLWLFEGRPPADGREVEIVIRAFRFRPL